MGYNTVVLILNDQLDQIARSPELFVKNLLDGIQRGYMDGQVDVHPGQATVCQTHHADDERIYIQSRNSITDVTGYGSDIREIKAKGDVFRLQRIRARLLDEAAVIERHIKELQKAPVKAAELPD